MWHTQFGRIDQNTCSQSKPYTLLLYLFLLIRIEISFSFLWKRVYRKFLYILKCEFLYLFYIIHWRGFGNSLECCFLSFSLIFFWVLILKGGYLVQKYFSLRGFHNLYWLSLKDSWLSCHTNFRPESIKIYGEFNWNKLGTVYHEAKWTRSILGYTLMPEVFSFSLAICHIKLKYEIELKDL